MSTSSGNQERASEFANRYRASAGEFGREAAILTRALEFAGHSAGLALTALKVARTVTNYAAESDDWVRTAASAARSLGLDPHERQQTPDHLPRDRPALVRAGPRQWLVVIGPRGHRCEVVRFDERGETRMTMTRAQLDAKPVDSTWLHLQPLLALDPIATEREPRMRTRPWLRLRNFLQLEKRELWIVVVYAMVIGALTLATPIAVQALVNTVAFGSVLQPLIVLTMLLFGGLAFSGLLSVLEAYVVEVLQRRVFVRVADDFGRRLPLLCPDAMEDKHGPELANRFFDVVTIQKSLAVLLLDGLALTLQTAIGMLLLGFYHPLLLTFDVVLIAFLVIVLLAGRGAVDSGLRESSAKYRTVAWLEDISRVPHLFRGERSQLHASQQTGALTRDYLAARKSHFRILMRQIAGGHGLQLLAIVALMGVGGWLVINRQLTLGQLVAAELIIAAIAAGFVKLGKNLEKLYDLNVGVLKLAKVVDIPMERRGGEPLRGAGPATLAVREATVQRGTKTLLRGAALEVAAGARIRIAGDSGSGKSTLLDVLGGLRPPRDGSVHIAGVDLRRVDLAMARDHLAVVRGSGFVVGSVIDNLRIAGCGHLDEPSVRELLRLVDLEEAIDTLPEGLDHTLQPSGAPLSETQARRLALVRALASRPRVLLVDRGLDNLGLGPAEFERLLDAVLGPEAPWTAVVVTDDPQVSARCENTYAIHEQSLEVVQ